LASASTNSPYPDTRTYSAVKLAQASDYTDKRAIPGLIELLKNDDRNSIDQAAKALGRIGDQKAIPPLLEALEENRGAGGGREAIVRALGRLKAKDAVALIIDVLNTKSHPERKAAAEALGEIGELQALPHLLRVSKDWKMHLDVRIAAVQSLGKLQDPSVVIDLLPIFHDRRQENVLRAAVADVLGDLGDIHTATELMLGLQEQDTNLLRAVIRSLGKLKAERSVDRLIPLLNPRSLTISSVTGEALENIGTPDALYAVEQWKKQQKKP
jgi:HEAT repeat protein